MSDLEKLLDELRGTMGKMEMALDSIDEAIVWVDKNARIQWCNGVFNRMLGRPHIEILGASLIEMLPLREQGELVVWRNHPISLILRGERVVRKSYAFHVGQQSMILEITGARFQAGDQGTSFVLTIRDIQGGERIEILKKEKEELAEANKIMLGREERVLELKQEVNELLKKSGQLPKYTL